MKKIIILIMGLLLIGMVYAENQGGGGENKEVTGGSGIEIIYGDIILEGDGICSSGERRDSVDCSISFDSVIVCLWDPNIKCSTTVIKKVVIILIMIFSLYYYFFKRKNRSEFGDKLYVPEQTSKRFTNIKDKLETSSNFARLETGFGNHLTPEDLETLKNMGWRLEATSSGTLGTVYYFERA